MRSNEIESNQQAAARNAVARVETLESRQYQAADHEIGINVNDSSSAAFAKAVPVLKTLGVTSVRLWYGVDQWSDRNIEGGLQRAIDYHNAGFDVTMTIAIDDKQVPNPSEVKNWFAWAAGNDNLRHAVDRWEIGNEVDSAYYFKGTIGQYVSNFLKPASEALHAEGEKVVSAGMSWNPQDVQEGIDDGMLDMVDAIGFHPYAHGVGQLKTRIQQVQNIVDGRKPILATEWNLRGEPNKTQWAASLADAYPLVRAGFDIDYYFALFVVDTQAGPAGLMSKSGVLNTSFYNQFLKATRGLGSTPTNPTPPPDDGGNTPSGTITKIALYDADTDRVISGYSNLTAGQVIDLADLPTRNLAIVVLPTDNAGSVKMTLNGVTKIENSKPYAYFGDHGTDLNGKKLAVGSYSFSVTPYLKDGAKGGAFTKRSLNFKITDSGHGTTPTPPTNPGNGDSDHRAEVDGFALVNAKTGQVISGYGHLTADTTISLSSFSGMSLALVALGDEDTKSVKLTSRNGTKIENTVPYAVFGDDHGKFAKWKPTKGSYSFGAVAYSGKNATGAMGSGLSFTLKFV